MLAGELVQSIAEDRQLPSISVSGTLYQALKVREPQLGSPLPSLTSQESSGTVQGDSHSSSAPVLLDDLHASTSLQPDHFLSSPELLSTFHHPYCCLPRLAPISHTLRTRTHTHTIHRELLSFLRLLLSQFLVLPSFTFLPSFPSFAPVPLLPLCVCARSFLSSNLCLL